MVRKKSNTKKERFTRGKEEVSCGSGIGGTFYGLAAIGSAAYYISVANGFWWGVLGVLRAFVWPLFLVYDLFKYLN